MTDYRYDHMAPNLPYSTYDNYNPMATNRLGLEQRGNSYQMNDIAPPQHRMMNSMYMQNKEYIRPNHFDNSMYVQDTTKRTDYGMNPMNPMMMNMTKSAPIQSNNVNYNYQPVMSRAPGMSIMDPIDSYSSPPVPYNQDLSSSSDWNRLSPLTSSVGLSSVPSFRSTPKQTQTTESFKPVSRVGSYSFDELKMKENTCYKEPPLLHSYVEPSVVNASLPFHFVLPKPALPAMQLHSFDTKILLYIFYSIPRDCLQLLACDELYQRNYVYNKTNSCWYKKESIGTNYSSIVSKERFDVNTWSFVSCNETLRSTDILSQAEVTEYIQKLQ